MVSDKNEQDPERLLIGRSPALKDVIRRSQESLQSGQGMSARAFWKAVKAARDRGRQLGK
jgi:hypothetical protein